MAAADLHNLDDSPTPPWQQFPNEFESLYDDWDRENLDEIALAIADAELDQVERWIDVAEQHDQSDQS